MCIVITVSPVKYSYIIWPICNILYTAMDCLKEKERERLCGVHTA